MPLGRIPLALTTSGNEITDLTRAANIQGDGRLNDSSYGIWAAATNLATNGGFETNVTGWIPSAQGIVGRSTTQAKFGSASGSVTSSGAGSNGALTNAGNNVTGAPITQVARTFSVWVLGSGATIGKTLSFQVNESGGVGGDAQLGGVAPATVVLSAAWQRVTVTGTPTNADRTTLYAFTSVPCAGAGEVYYIDGFQIETGSVATPYVETNGGTASRAAARVQAPSSILNATQGWVAMRVRMGFPSTTLPNPNDVRFFSTGDASNNILWFFSNGGSLYLARQGGGVGYAENTQVISWVTGDILTVIARWTATGLSSSLNGAAFTVPTAQTTIPTTIDPFDIGSLGALNRQVSGDVFWFACGTGTLTDPDALTIHNFGNANPLMDAFPTNAHITGLWTADSPTMQFADWSNPNMILPAIAPISMPSNPFRGR